MAYSVTTSGFTTASGSPSNLVDGDPSTKWSYNNFANGDDFTITVDTGGWFDASTVHWYSHKYGGYPYNLMSWGSAYDEPFPYWAIQISADGVDWYNITVVNSAVFFGAVGRSDTEDVGNFNGAAWSSYEANPWPRAEYFRYIRYIGVNGGVFNQYNGPFYLRELQFFQSDGVTPISVDTGGGANPNPPTGTPDTDPNLPGDTHVPARVSGALLSVARIDDGSVKVSSVTAAVVRSDVGVARATSVSVAVLSRAPANFAADIVDDSKMTVILDDGGKRLKAALVDESVMTIDLTATSPVHLAADLTDESVLGVYSSLDITFPSWSSFNTGRS